jgi:hypothetical protein
MLVAYLDMVLRKPYNLRQFEERSISLPQRPRLTQKSPLSSFRRLQTALLSLSPLVSAVAYGGSKDHECRI